LRFTIWASHCDNFTRRPLITLEMLMTEASIPQPLETNATENQALAWIRQAYDRLIYLEAVWDGDPDDGVESGGYVRSAGCALGKLGHADLVAESLALAPVLDVPPIITSSPHCGVNEGIIFLSSCISRLSETKAPEGDSAAVSSADDRPKIPKSWENAHRWVVAARTALGAEATQAQCHSWGKAKEKEGHLDMPPLVDEVETFKAYERRANQFYAKNPSTKPYKLIGKAAK
jgi:hypothetical protein